jgi:hypothetical protein
MAAERHRLGDRCVRPGLGALAGGVDRGEERGLANVDRHGAILSNPALQVFEEKLVGQPRISLADEGSLLFGLTLWPGPRRRLSRGCAWSRGSWHRRHAGIDGFLARDRHVLVGLLWWRRWLGLGLHRGNRGGRGHAESFEDVPGGLIGLEMHHVGHEPDRVLDQVEAAVLSVEASVQLGKFITHPGAERIDVGGRGFVEVDAGHGFHANCGKKLRLILMISATTTPAMTSR